MIIIDIVSDIEVHISYTKFYINIVSINICFTKFTIILF